MNVNQYLISLTFVIGIRRRTIGSLAFDSINVFQVHAIIASSDRDICDGSAFLYRRNKSTFTSYIYIEQNQMR